MSSLTRAGACALVAATLLTTAFTATAGSAQKPTVGCLSADGVADRYRPRTCEFVSSRGQAGIYVEKIRWSSWTSTRAVGKGTWRGNMDAVGKARIVLSAPDRCGEGAAPWFSRSSISIDGAKPTKSPLVGPCS